MTTLTQPIQGGPIAPLVIGPLIPRLVAIAAGAYVLAVGVLTLLGYALDVRRLSDWYDHGISMFPNAAACGALSGVAILMLGTTPHRKWRRIALRLFAATVGLVGGLTLLQHLTGVNLGIDTLLFERDWGRRAAAAPMRMGPPASSSYLITGLSLLLATDGPRARQLASALGILIVVISSLSLVGFWFGADQLFGVARFTGIALQTSTVLAAIGIGLIASVPEGGLAKILRRDDPGGVIVRRLLLPIVAIPLTAGWLRLLGQQAGYFDAAFGTALFVLLMITLLVGLLLWTANGVSRQAAVARAADQGVRESEARRRVAATALQESDRRKTEFLGILAHELRNPLAPISNAVQLMRAYDSLAPDLARLREMMDGQVRQLVRLIDDLMDVSRITRGKLELRRRRASLRQIVEQAVEACGPSAQEHRHKVVVKQTAGDAALDADPERLIQVVCNLLHNAIRYTPDQGTITLTTALENRDAVIRVVDTGVGIAPDKSKEIFEMFAQAQPNSMGAGGLGIGLSLAKTLVEMHGGTIAVHSAGPGHGSEFTVRLPVLDATCESPSPGPSEPVPKRRFRVLVVDDHKVVGDSFAMLLESMGQEVRVARSARQALEMAPQYRPHVIFSDISMPEMNGYELARRFRADERLAGTRLIAVTGYGQTEDVQAARMAGFHDHMVKPPTTEQLKRLFNRIDIAESVSGKSNGPSDVVTQSAARP